MKTLERNEKFSPILYVALRPDQNRRLVSYASYTKCISEGDRTGFHHIDMNMPPFLGFGHGDKTIQESVSKDDASGDRCTVVAKVFSETERHGGMIRFEKKRPQLLVSVLAIQENFCLPSVVG